MLTRLGGQTDPENRTVLTGAAATPDALVRALVGLQSRVRPGDAVLVHIDGMLAADSTAVGPSIVLTGGEVPVTYLSRLLRALDSSVTLVSTHISTGHLWQAPLPSAPGAEPSPGCLEPADQPRGRVVDLGSPSLEALLTALSGVSDRNADGRVTAGELSRALGVAPQDGVVAHDSNAVVVRLGGDR